MYTYIKNSLWFTGDVLTRVGCGMIGGATIYAFTNGTNGIYWTIFLGATIITILGYALSLIFKK